MDYMFLLFLLPILGILLTSIFILVYLNKISNLLTGAVCILYNVFCEDDDSCEEQPDKKEMN